MATHVRQDSVRKGWVDAVFYAASFLVLIGAFRWQWWHEIIGNWCMGRSGANPPNVGVPPLECGVEGLSGALWREQCARCVDQAWSLFWLSAFLAGAVWTLAVTGWLMNRGQLPGKPGPPGFG